MLYFVEIFLGRVLRHKILWKKFENLIYVKFVIKHDSWLVKILLSKCLLTMESDIGFTII
jgi:hypothetical protein